MIPLDYDSGPGTKVLLAGIITGAIATTLDLLAFGVLAFVAFMAF